MLGLLILAVGLQGATVVAATGAPSVSTSDGSTWVGKQSCGADPIDSFLGIPFAQPPVGDLRFAPPRAPVKGFGTFNATSFGPACPQPMGAGGADPKALDVISPSVQELLATINFFTFIPGSSEDCLSLNIQRPAGTKATDKLPVLFWIYGGAFTSGGTQEYDGSKLITRSVAMKTPVIYVSVNYRVNSFGFLGGREVEGDPSTSVNAGLLDQRMAMEWVQKHIGAFGGDREKVTLYGQSAGSISIGFHLLAYDGKVGGLFRGAIMESGSPIPVEGAARGQVWFDVVADGTGCGNATDKIKCLRAAPYAKLLEVTSAIPGGLSYRSLSLPFLPRTDGTFLTAQAQDLYAAGKYAKNIAILSGNQYDEGTLQALGTMNITTSKQLDHWLKTNWFPNTTDSQREQMLKLYPGDPRAGSPFDTGMQYSLTPQNKRINAQVGDFVFQTCRRLLLSFTAQTQPTWSWAGRTLRHTPLLGSFHASEIFNVFGQSALPPTMEVMSRWIAFANNLDPNVPGFPNWPQYGTAKNLLQFSEDGSTVIPDTYREEAIGYWSTIFKDLAL